MKLKIKKELKEKKNWRMKIKKYFKKGKRKLKIKRIKDWKLKREKEIQKN